MALVVTTGVAEVPRVAAAPPPPCRTFAVARRRRPIASELSTREAFAPSLLSSWLALHRPLESAAAMTVEQRTQDRTRGEWNATVGSWLLALFVVTYFKFEQRRYSHTS